MTQGEFLQPDGEAESNRLEIPNHQVSRPDEMRDLMEQLSALVEKLEPISKEADQQREDQPDDEVIENRAREFGSLVAIASGYLIFLQEGSIINSIDLAEVKVAILDVRIRLNALLTDTTSAGKHQHRISQIPPPKLQP